MNRTLRLAFGGLCLAGAGLMVAAELVVTEDFRIGPTETAFEGHDLRVQAGRLTIEGGHRFGTLAVAGQSEVSLKAEQLEFRALTVREAGGVTLEGGTRVVVEGAVVLTDQAEVRTGGDGR